MQSTNKAVRACKFFFFKFHQNDIHNVEKECAQVEKNKSIKHENKIVRSFRKSKVGVILLNEETLRSGKGDVDLTSWAMVG